ncbi:MAG: trehalase family glycosidase [Saprospiraceae bacterium]|nr:trehalase family glycosidase [Saprospiraceae bacterium]
MPTTILSPAKRVFGTRAELRFACQNVLEKNSKETFTIPCEGLYPFQWLWDSAFIAVGWAHIDHNRARAEFQSLFDAQWSNGFMAHIIYHDDDRGKSYFPGSAFQGAARNPYSPTHVVTSGITQPPNLGAMLEILFDKELSEQVKLSPLNTPSVPDPHFYKKAIRHIFRFHEYLYRDRDPHNEGLTYIRHNWEAGTDNCTQFDAIWNTFDPINYDVQRRDTQHVNPKQRPTKKDYNYYLTLIEISRSVDFDEREMYEILPFLVQDPLFNSLLVASGESLARMARHFGMNVIAEQSEKWAMKTRNAMNEKLLDPLTGVYGYFDLRNNRLVGGMSSSNMTPLFAGIPSQKSAERLRETLESLHFAGRNNEYWLCATNAVTDPQFDRTRYWRGPVWININWLIWKGCLRYGFDDLARRIKRDTINLVLRYGVYEYFDPLKSAADNPEAHGFGGNNFSWTAALILDMLAENQ